MNAKAKLIAWLGAAVVAGAAGFISTEESTVLAAYKDPLGIWTACTGETAYVVTPGDIKAGAKYTKEQCTERLYDSMWKHAEPVIRCTAPAQLTTGQKVAFLDLAYNMGGTNFCSLTFLLAKVKAGDVPGSCAAISRYVMANRGKVDCRIRSNNCYGVVLRREKERAICES